MLGEEQTLFLDNKKGMFLRDGDGDGIHMAPCFWFDRFDPFLWLVELETSRNNNVVAE